jgi:hypothetical protein
MISAVVSRYSGGCGLASLILVLPQFGTAR